MTSVDMQNRSSLTLMAITSGSSDVIAFLLLGHVFASAMTGNTALLGIALSDGNLIAASQPVSALLGFAAGVALATLLDAPDKPGFDPRKLLVLEITCLVLFALLWGIGSHSAGDPAQYVLILLCSVAMGIQGVVARRLNAPGVNTIVFTTTLVTIISSAVGILSGRVDDPAVRRATAFQVSAFVAYGSGAVLAGLLHWVDFPYLAWLPAAAAVAVLATVKRS